MGQALYRKYRSKKLSEVIGQEHITKTLQNALKSGQISHAYLLTGPKGTGKTSVARILAHEVNNLPYTDDSMHLDIIEIDAASNRRIDEIRDLREKVNLAPTSAKYKVYIIDEVHMLTREAFNALLKTLEEPPEHVIFILATTELHKLPDTIISRTQRYGFKPVSIEDMVPHLRQIATAEGITIDDKALTAIATHASGGFRDAISLLDQARGSGKSLKAADIESLLGRAPAVQIEACLEAILKQDSYKALSINSELINDGHNPETLASQIITTARELLLKGISRPETVLGLMTSLLEVSRSSNPSIALELAILRAGGSNHLADEAVEKVIHKPETIKNLEKPSKIKPEFKPEESKSDPKTSTEKTNDFNIDKLWQDTLEKIKGEHNTLYGILRMADFSVTGPQELTLAFQFPFHMKRAAEAKHLAVITKTLKLISGKDYAIQFKKRTIEAPKVEKAEKTTEKKEGTALDTVRDVFGDAELLD